MNAKLDEANSAVSSTFMFCLARSGQVPFAAEQKVYGLELDLIQLLQRGWRQLSVFEAGSVYLMHCFMLYYIVWVNG